jgi:pyridoxine/pyridoxamine 5'-phosphate oxidase
MIAAMARHGHDPIAKFIRWLEDARCARIPNCEAMALATAARSGKTSVPFVLLKGIDQRGSLRTGRWIAVGQIKTSYARAIDQRFNIAAVYVLRVAG